VPRKKECFRAIPNRSRSAEHQENENAAARVACTAKVAGRECCRRWNLRRLVAFCIQTAQAETYHYETLHPL
jgi:hypothetical protein